MGWAAYHLCGGASLKKKYKLSGTVSNVGIPQLMTATTGNVTSVTASGSADSVGLGLDTGVYSATQGDTEGILSIDIRPDLVIGMTISGGGTEGTALTTLSNTAAEGAGTTITDADVGSDDMDGGTVWSTKGANVGQSRTITTHNSGTDFVVTVPFLNDIAAGDEFLFVPWNTAGVGNAGNDGPQEVTLTTNLYQADQSTASGAGIATMVTDLRLKGTQDSQVYFTLRDHVFGTDTSS